MRTAILDDELHSAELLRHLLERHCPQIQVTHLYTQSEVAAKELKSDPPELIFLDIEMPRMNGFEFLATFPSVPFSVIFTTAYDQYAVRAFKFSAIDYLLKPIDITELKEAVRKASTLQAPEPAQLDILHHMRHPDASPGRIALSTMEGLTFVDIQEIIHCESHSAYTYLYLTGDRKYFLSRHLKEIAEVLEPAGFVRVHNRHLINIRFVSNYRRGEGGEILMTNGHHIPVSRSKKSLFLDRILKI